ncbi:cyclodeaminase/cyclohydrolase family protein [Streptoalloteichus hindustanus]|uniref:Formiminotetrahydrofolate cyclodeaminase n=1 Tax=Streptoalloteichus hindustanus TaxID=2017 RepID=A0A1M5P5X7_STRHI|nr:cyclodeaminase/cyclohydrolase family protein [Streptoalloteichus hindustanus]SHG97200.1 Formiminotetrahydrofolate cyclodeaminase [Streptoalloteichus hindustanus]
MRDHVISDFLDRLAARVPAPGGGAVAALHAAQGAALLAMVARYSTGPKHQAHEATISEILDEAERLRVAALRLMAENVAAFGAVAEAYKLPKDTSEARRSRSAAIAGALVGAAMAPAELIGVAERLVSLAETLRPIGNRTVISDVAAAVEAARAAATTAQINVETNLAGITDPAVRDELTARAGLVQSLARRAEHVTALVRKEIAR